MNQAGHAGRPGVAGPEQAAQIPSPDRPFHWPIGTSPADRASPELPPGWSASVGFGTAYEPLPGRPAIHPGVDLNLRSGGDSDFDAPVHAAADGIVTASGSYRVWGNIVVIAHSLPEGGTVWSQYAHLNQRLVAAGQAVQRGDLIGTIGKGEASRFSAHLHFEIRVQDLRPAHWPGLDPVAVRRGYRDPVLVIRDGRSGLELQAAAERLRPAGSVTDPAVASGYWSRTPPGQPGSAVPPKSAVSPGSTSRGSVWTRPAASGPRPPVGKGVFVERLWEIDRGDPAGVARRARALGLRFIVLRLAHGDQPWAVNFTAERGAATARGLHAAELDVWGWGTLTDRSPKAAAALVADRCREFDLTGWVVEPAHGCPPAAIEAFLEGWRSTSTAARLALLADRPGLPAPRESGEEVVPSGRDVADPGLAELADACDAVMPRVTQVGALGLAVAGAVGFGRPIVPVLDLRGAGDAQVAGSLFLDLARSGGRPGAAVMTWDSCQLSPTGRDALRALALFGWQPDAVAEAPPPAGRSQPPGTAASSVLPSLESST